MASALTFKDLPLGVWTTVLPRASEPTSRVGDYRAFSHLGGTKAWNDLVFPNAAAVSRLLVSYKLSPDCPHCCGQTSSGWEHHIAGKWHYKKLWQLKLVPKEGVAIERVADGFWQHWDLPPIPGNPGGTVRFNHIDGSVQMWAGPGAVCPPAITDQVLAGATSDANGMPTGGAVADVLPAQVGQQIRVRLVSVDESGRLSCSMLEPNTRAVELEPESDEPVDGEEAAAAVPDAEITSQKVDSRKKQMARKSTKKAADVTPKEPGGLVDFLDESTLSQCLQSLLDQGYDSVELLKDLDATEWAEMKHSCDVVFIATGWPVQNRAEGKGLQHVRSIWSWRSTAASDLIFDHPVASYRNPSNPYGG